MEDRIKELEAENEKLKNILRKAFPEKSGKELAYQVCNNLNEQVEDKNEQL